MMEYRIKGNAVALSLFGPGDEIVLNRESLVTAIRNIEHNEFATDAARSRMLRAYIGALVYLDHHINDEGAAS